jgi:mTERF domain-containing protein
VEDYLVERCGLTQAQALKASTKLSHLKSPTKPDTVLAFLAGLGLSRADVAALVARDPRFLCTGVDKILASNVAGLRALGLSPSEVARLVPLTTHKFRCRSIVSKLHYYLPLFGSAENLLRVLKYSDDLLGGDLDRMVKPNVAFLRECGIDAVGISKLCLTAPRADAWHQTGTHPGDGGACRSYRCALWLRDVQASAAGCRILQPGEDCGPRGVLEEHIRVVTC